MNKIISLAFSLLPIFLGLALSLWRRRQIYKQEERAEEEMRPYEDQRTHV